MKTISAIRHQKGFTLVSAVFLLVIIAALGAYMVTMSGVQTRTGFFSLQGARAYHAAKSGIEWGIYQASTGVCNAETSFPVGGGNVTVSCECDTYTEGVSSYNVYRIESVAEYGAYGSKDYVSRRLETKIR